MRKEIRSWAIIGLIFLILYTSGLHTEVIGFAQRIVLATGLISPDTELPIEEPVDLDFNIIGLDGKTINVSQFKGKVIFLNLWATWCPPCIAEMPGIQNLYNNMDSENVAFVILSVDADIEKVNKFIDRKEFTFPVYHAGHSIPSAFRSGSIPATFVISKDENIVMKKIGMADYDSEKFVKYLKKLSSK